MFGRIRHVAIYTEHHQKTARFYQTIFGMKKITTGMTDEKGNYDRSRGHISDGIIGLALLQRQAGTRSGLDHFGFEVESAEIVLGRLRGSYPDLRVATSLEHVPFSVLRIQDPAGTHIDVSQKGVVKVREGYLEEGWEQPRHLHHIAIRAAEPSRLADFYQSVFELRPVEGMSEKGQLCLSDGKISLVVIPCENSSYRAMTEGLDHIGFKVEALKKVEQELGELSQSHPDSSPRKIDIGRFGHVIKKELESCMLGSYALSDPDGVLMDFSE
jgi:catechol 2,3-dioxygenase-like lactoylglutathione lyase family enzyme